MMGMNNRVNAFISIGLIIGLGIFGLFMVQATSASLSAESSTEASIPVAPGVKLKFQVDKSIYRTSETVLSALRNDSRKTIWLADHADGCSDQWWQVQQLDSDGETWRAVALSKQTCTTKQYSSHEFTKHTVMSSEWNIRIPAPQLGNVVTEASAGTYRLAAPYIASPKMPGSADWLGTSVRMVYTPTFTVQ